MNSEFLQKLRKKNPGESLLEVMIALVILGTVLIGVFSVLTRTSAANANIKNQIVALNLAREGIEAVRNIRDTNWLKFSGDRRNRWLCLDNACAEKITAGNYTTEFDSGENRYLLFEIGSSNSLELATDPANFESFQLYFDETANRSTHATSGTPTIFYRQIRLTPGTPFSDSLSGNEPIFCDGNVAACATAKLEITSHVEWREGNATRSVRLGTNLFDFFERESYK
ncbi:hypothetical protein HN954_04180 [bacterium]|jgi:type II secretory pathway pseudopilin PulG|nr:hypothetical protein [bacterium]MBT6831774.1 hypothetical protein [bacterium]MBT6996597.1 hypothetical protein [bacterium]MBT7772923.1 hypothetical protein [bacterium]